MSHLETAQVGLDRTENSKEALLAPDTAVTLARGTGHAGTLCHNLELEDDPRRTVCARRIHQVLP